MTQRTGYLHFRRPLRHIGTNENRQTWRTFFDSPKSATQNASIIVSWIPDLSLSRSLALEVTTSGVVYAELPLALGQEASVRKPHAPEMRRSCQRQPTPRS